MIGPPYGGVKEHGPGVYANELAQRGFVCLAFDPSYNGESNGEPRHLSTLEIFSEDFSAAFAISAAAMYDFSGMGTLMDHDKRAEMLDGMARQRWDDVDAGAPAYQRTYPADGPLDELPENLEGTNAEWWMFYGIKRGWHPNAGGAFTNTSMLPFMNYALLSHIDSISPRPILFITGDIAHSRSMSEGFYAAASEPKELFIVEGAMHIDLYDDVTKIPCDKLGNFF